jgi:uncharacterized protein
MRSGPLLEINVSQMLKAPVGTTQNLEIADRVAIMENESKVEGEVTLTRTNRGILARGRLKAGVEASCCRCLSLFNCDADFSFEEEYFPSTDILSGARLELPEEPESFTINEQHTLDLTEAIRQYALMALPMKPLCRPDCTGAGGGPQNAQPEITS